MQTINSASDLKNAIKQLESEREIQGLLLKEQFFITYESMKPLSLILSTLKDITSSPYLVNNIFTSVLGFLGGYISKKSPEDKSNHPIKKILGNVLQSGITTFIMQHPSAIKLVGGLLVKYLFSKNKSKSPKSDN